MSMEFLRRAQLDENIKQQIRKRVKQLLQQKQQDTDQPDSPDSADEQSDDSEGTVYLFDASEHPRGRIALEFNTRKEFEEYRKTHDLDPATKVKILDEGKGKSNKPDDEGERRGPDKDEEGVKKGPKKPEDDSNKTPIKDDEENGKGQPPIRKTEDGEDKTQDGEKKTEKEDDQGDKGEGKKQEPRKPGELLEPSHPARVPEGMHRQVAIKDRLIDELGAEAKDWKVHGLHLSQLSSNVTIKFPDGSSKKYGDLTPDEKTRVDKAVSEGLAASKGMRDYTSVSPSAFQHNMKTNLGRYDDPDVEEVINESDDPITADNVGKFTSSLRESGRTLLKKYAESMSGTSRPMAERYVDTLADTISEGVRDGSLAGVKQSQIDEFVRESVKRVLHQEVETRYRSLGDHGVRHVAGNVRSTMGMLGELQGSGIKITGKQKLMAVAAMTDHDIGYTVGDVGIDITKGKKHKQYSKELVDQERERYDGIFGKEDGDRIRAIIATHDDPVFDWEQDPVGSSVRLADNTSLFGEEKVQDLFLRSPKATALACKLRLAAESKPDDKKLQDDIKAQMHEVVDSGEFEDADREALHAQIDEMSEGKFSTTTDILSRFSGKLKGFKYDSNKKMMNVNMQYSSEGQMVDQLFGDEVACRQFEKFSKDLGGDPVRGKRGHTVFKDQKGKPVFQLNIDGFDEKDEPSTAAMRDFAKKTARTELRRASMIMYPPPPAGEKDIAKAKKAMEPAKEKFSEAEWKMLMKAFDEGTGDPVVLAKKLGMWPLLQSEMDYLEGKTASDRIVRRLLISMLSDRVARDYLAARGQQLQRKDKDLMDDTGGVSKHRRREPKIKPPRSDSQRRYRTKDKPSDQRDIDVDKKAKMASDVSTTMVHPLDETQAGFGELLIPADNYHRKVVNRLINIMAELQHVSEKDFSGMDQIVKAAEMLVRSPKGERMVQTFIGVGARPEMCAEGMYLEMVIKGKTASIESMARSALSNSPRTFREAILRG